MVYERLRAVRAFIERNIIALMMKKVAKWMCDKMFWGCKVDVMAVKVGIS